MSEQARSGTPDVPEDALPQILPVFLVPDDDDDDADLERVGTVLFSPGGELELEHAEPAHEAILQDALARVNAKGEIVLRSTTPMAAEDAVGAVAFARGSPGFPEAVRSYLERFYGLRLG